MPIYEYLCDKCGHEFEREQRITDEAVKTCPACRGRKVRRLISRTAFVLKGSGWYSDLYSSAKPGAATAGDAGAAGDAAGASKSEGAAESKGVAESKGAAKPEGAAKPKPPAKAPKGKAAA